MSQENIVTKKSTATGCAPCTKKNNQGKTCIVHTADNLNALLFTLRAKYETVIIAVPLLTEEENLTWQQRIAKDYNACGCTTGSYFLIAGFIVVVCLAFSNWQLVVSSPFSYLCKMLLFLCLCAIIGKIVGWSYAKIRLQINILKLKQLLIN